MNRGDGAAEVIFQFRFEPLAQLEAVPFRLTCRLMQVKFNLQGVGFRCQGLGFRV